MTWRRYLSIAAVGALLAGPALAQTSSPTVPGSRTPSTMPSAPSPSGASRGATTGATQGAPIDINSASAQELDALPGIGPARAQAIVANRPYRSKDELAQRKILPQNVYNQIKDRIVARQATGRESSGSSARPSGGSGTK
ncbi:MAG TPA: helix-hairpin-helix domain-containing protein [Stellaceae bacterium]|nr:helix-hairpin-helix domain-containing protein [Stellaceae bacterium]